MWRFYPTTTSQKTPTSDLQQLEEMFCQRDATYELNSLSAHPLKKGSSTPRKCKPLDLQQKPVFVDKYLDPQSPDIDETFGKEHECSENGIEILKAQRHQLEKDVFGLQDRLQQEVDLHYALENAFRQEAAVTPTLASLPLHAQELVTDIAMLEVAIAHLEQQIASLNLQLGYEQRERQRAEGSFMKLPMQVTSQEGQRIEPSCNQLGGEFVSTLQQPCCSTVSPLASPLSPRFSDTPSPSKGSFMGVSAGNFGSPAKQLLFQDFYANDSPLPPDRGIPNPNPGCKHVKEQPDLVSPEKLKSKPPSMTYQDRTTDKIIGTDLKNSWLQPNKLSQDMVNCMISIYRHLADPTDKFPLKMASSPTSPYGNVTASSISSISESSLSLNPSPAIDPESKDLGYGRSFDPYKAPEKLPWPDIGTYSTAIEVSEMLVGKEQLEYAAEALRTFRSLVEQLSQVDPSSMKHNEKLAFWINVYNALMMHAYLAYGVPKNDFKFFSLMQKAAYTVGGHSFNAVVIEHLLLKAKAQWYRPQMALLLAHQKLKLRDEVSMFAIDRVEPLVTFSLSFGACSSPAVRVYTAENVHEELQLSLKEYARASVGLSVRGKLLLPKLLFDFACEVVDEADVPDWICQFLPSQQSSLIRNCIKHRQHKFLNSKHFCVIPFDFRFRYLFLLGQMRNTNHRKT